MTGLLDQLHAHSLAARAAAAWNERDRRLDFDVALGFEALCGLALGTDFELRLAAGDGDVDGLQLGPGVEPKLARPRGGDLELRPSATLVALEATDRELIRGWRVDRGAGLGTVSGALV